MNDIILSEPVFTHTLSVTASITSFRNPTLSLCFYEKHLIFWQTTVLMCLHTQQI